MSLSFWADDFVFFPWGPGGGGNLLFGDGLWDVMFLGNVVVVL